MDPVVLADAWTAANHEGLRHYRAVLHVGGVIEGVATGWSDIGILADPEDDWPTRDFRGNTVARFGFEKLDPANPQHAAMVYDWLQGN